MARPICRVIARILILVFCLNQVVSAQTSWQPGYGTSVNGQANKSACVTSVVLDDASSLVLISFSKKVQLPTPVIHFLQAGQGESTLVADFPGVISNLPPQIINVSKTEIRQVRIGQFQVNPPILRVAISTYHPSFLNRIAFNSSPGMLVVKWNEHISNVQVGKAQGTNAPIDNNVKSNQVVEKPKEKQIEETAIAKQLKKMIQLQEKSDVKSDVKKEAKLETKTETKKEISQTAISISQAKNATEVTVKLKPKSYIYKSFRLHDPERYVCDIANFPDLKEAALPSFASNSNLHSLRLGSPINDPTISRLVLDLTNANTIVDESSNSSLLTLTVQNNSIPNNIAENAPSNLHKTNDGKVNSKLEVDTIKSVIAGYKTIVLDAGHGGNDTGAQRGDIQEKEITLQIAKRLKEILIANGIKVIMTRDEDKTVSLGERVNIANSVHPDLFLSVHINSLESDSDIHGIETYYLSQQSQALAQCIHESLVLNLQAPDRNIRKARFYVINHTIMPSVLAEVGFISNKEERHKLISSDYQKEITNALAKGVILYLSNKAHIALGVSKDQQMEKSGATN